MNTKEELLSITDADFETSSKSCNKDSRVSNEDLQAINHRIKNVAQNTNEGGVIWENLDEEKRYRNFAFTDWSNSITILESVRYLLYGKEVAPTTGNIHRQGLIIFNNAKTPAAARKLYPGVYIKPCRKNILANARYCIKDGDYVEEGIRPPSLNKIFREDNQNNKEVIWRLCYIQKEDENEEDIISDEMSWNDVQRMKAFWGRVKSKKMYISWSEIVIMKNDVIYDTFII